MLYANGAYAPHAPQRVVSGAGTVSRLGNEAGRLPATRIMVVTSPSVATKTIQIQRVHESLGAACVGVFEGVHAHSPIEDVVNGAELARQLQIDALVSCGGGSAIDVSKGIALMVGAELIQADQLEAWFADTAVADRRPSIRRHVPHLAVPTTSSGAEFTGIIGLSDCDSRRKRLIFDEAFVPDVVVLDPTVTLTTPATLWLSSAVRALDHAVEALYGRDSSPLTETLALRAIGLMFDALPRSHADTDDLPSRLATQIATWHATWAAARAGTGLSHGIGYVLGGTYGVPHGLCSCATLSAVMEWNLEATVIPQALMARTIGIALPVSEHIAAARKASHAVRSLVAKLGLPFRLRELGGIAQGDLPSIAERVFQLPHRTSNPRVAQRCDEVLQLLKAAW